MGTSPDTRDRLRRSRVQAQHIHAELDRLREGNVERLIDLLVVRKDEEGNVERLRSTDLGEEELEELGATVGALIGASVREATRKA